MPGTALHDSEKALGVLSVVASYDEFFQLKRPTIEEEEATSASGNRDGWSGW